MVLNLKPIIKKEIFQIIRDKRALGVLLFIPAFMLVMFGYALNFDVKHIKLAVYDEDNSAESREFVQNFTRSEYFDLIKYLDDSDEIDRLMATERIKAAFVIPEDFSHNLIAGREARVQVIIDGANANSASTIVGYVQAITSDFSGEIVVDALKKIGKTGMSLPVDFRPRIWFNPELKSAKFLVPGLIGFILMVTAVISTALSVVRERERGTMEQITVSPIKPVELIIGKVIPYIFISLGATVMVLLFGFLLFGVEIKGSILLLFLVTLIFIIGCLGLGVLISTFAKTQQVAFMIAAMATMLPTFILSGFVFPIRNMPVIVQAVTYLVPARYYLVALRAIILKGVGIWAFWDQLLFMLAFAFMTIVASSVRASKIRL
ncbi:MAG: ABC transporter permease subunit [candidate division Zixibacteria bacterium]|nr:ABC transporter permease subunit [candidate division Zixibacteria bacterium]